MIDLGPGRGRARRARSCAAGTPAEIMANPESLTGRYLAGARADPGAARSGARRHAAGRIGVRGARGEQPAGHRRVDFPLGAMTVRHRRLGLGQVHAGRSTSSTARSRGGSARAATSPGAHDELAGWQLVDKVIDIDQSPIGRTPALEPRDLHEALRPDPRPLRAAARGARARLQAGALLLQREGRALRGLRGRRRERRSRCTSCPTSTCPARSAAGRRFNRETLEVQLQGPSASPTCST